MGITLQKRMCRGEGFLSGLCSDSKDNQDIGSSDVVRETVRILEFRFEVIKFFQVKLISSMYRKSVSNIVEKKRCVCGSDLNCKMLGFPSWY